MKKKNSFDYESRFEMQFRGIDCTRTRLDNGYTLVFIQDPLPTVKERGRLYIKTQVLNKKAERGFCVKYRGEKDIFFGTYRKEYVSVGNRLFTKKKWDNVVRYNGKQVICNAVSSELILFILDFMRLECISNAIMSEDDRRYGWIMRPFYSKMFNNKYILRRLVTGKITNYKQLFKDYVGQVYKLKNFNYEKVHSFLLLDYCYGAVNLFDLIDYTTSYEKAIDFIMHYRVDEKVKIFNDLVRDASILEKKVNPCWSYKRMHQEHQRSIEEMAMASEATLSDTSLYESDDLAIDERGVCGKVLNSEREIYIEANTQHHCLYTHYFSRIAQYNYIALSIEKPERLTVGILYNEKEKSYRCEQVHTYRNGNPSQSIVDMINDYVNSHQEKWAGICDKERHRPGKQYETPCVVNPMGIDLPY